MDGEVIGSALRSHCHDGSKKLHPVVHLHLFNSCGELFLQKRASTKDVFPDKWDSSASGHILLGETPLAAVLREAKEELSVELPDVRFIEKYVIETELERELSYCFSVVYDGEIAINEEELSDGRFWTLSEISLSLQKGIFTENFESDFIRFLR